MPIRPKKEIQKRTGGELTAPELEDLIQGYCFFDEPFKTDEAREKCWRKNRDYIMGLQGKAGKNEAMSFGSDKVYFDFLKRPHAWWAYDAPKPRLYISCKNNFCPYFSGCPVAQNIPKEAPDCVIRRGEERKDKSSFDGVFKIESVGHKFNIFLPTIESEKDFLQRHNLLNEAEKNR